MNPTLVHPPLLPQFEQDVFASSIDCEHCKIENGMRLRSAWNSVVDTGTMNICFECEFCHKRKWDRRAIVEVKV